MITHLYDQDATLDRALNYWRDAMNEYSRNYEIRWSDLDANGHVNYSAYINAAGDLRYRFFWEHNFPPDKFEELGSGRFILRSMPSSCEKCSWVKRLPLLLLCRDFRRKAAGGRSSIISSSPTGKKQSALRWRGPS